MNTSHKNSQFVHHGPDDLEEGAATKNCTYHDEHNNMGETTSGRDPEYCSTWRDSHSDLHDFEDTCYNGPVRTDEDKPLLVMKISKRKRCR